MLETKLFEILDAGTYIPVLAIKMAPWNKSTIEEAEIDTYHLKHTGYGLDYPCIMLICMEPPIKAEYDVFAWDAGSNIRTMREAHHYINRRVGIRRSGGRRIHPRSQARAEDQLAV